VENGVKLYVSKDQDTSVFHQWKLPLSNFIQVLKYLSDIFKLSTETIRVFYDSGDSVAFNRERSLFFNFKHYKFHHDSEFSPFSTNIMISWYLTFAHEIAHNIRVPHDAQHEVRIFMSLVFI